MSGPIHIIYTQTPEQVAANMTRQVLAPPSVIALACELQRVAFYGEREYDEPFAPAPLYVQQAFAMWENVKVRSVIARMIEELGK